MGGGGEGSLGLARVLEGIIERGLGRRVWSKKLEEGLGFDFLCERGEVVRNCFYAWGIRVGCRCEG